MSNYLSNAQIAEIAGLGQDSQKIALKNQIECEGELSKLTAQMHSLTEQIEHWRRVQFLCLHGFWAGSIIQHKVRQTPCKVLNVRCWRDLETGVSVRFCQQKNNGDWSKIERCESLQTIKSNFQILQI